MKYLRQYIYIVEEEIIMVTYTADQIYTKLIDEGIKDAEGNVTIQFMNVTTLIKEASAIGDLFQEWLGSWFKHHNIDVEANIYTQEAPDFYICPTDKRKGWLEIKTFVDGRSPAFDIANFEAYCHSLRTKAYRLDSDYLIFAYSLLNGQLKVKKLWLKKIWDIAGNSAQYPIKVQAKRLMIYNIRPVYWESTRSRYKPFQTKEKFLIALNQTLKNYGRTTIETEIWLQEVVENYFEHTGEQLLIDNSLD